MTELKRQQIKVARIEDSMKRCRNSQLAYFANRLEEERKKLKEMEEKDEL